MGSVPWVRGLTAILLATAAATAEETPGWLQVTGPPELRYPRDHGAHFEYRTEWWYVTGVVADEGGHRFGFQITFFRQGLAPGDPRPGDSRLRARQVVAAHLAIADISAQRFHHSERLRRVAGGLAGASQTDLEVWLDDWQMKRGADGVISVRARDPERGTGLELELHPEREPVRHGDRGYSQKGGEKGNASVYLSWTRLQVVGEMEVDDTPVTVTGEAWFDHEWGTSQLGAEVVGWDWFSLRLDDGRDVMLYQLRRANGSENGFSSGTIVSPGGETVRLAAEDFEIVPTEHWTSRRTGGTYPSRWRLRVPRYGLDLMVLPLLADAELDGTATTGVVYWEGPVEAGGSHVGAGYVELTGYAGTLEGLF
jgi:predicted secreted hydrolase